MTLQKRFHNAIIQANDLMFKGSWRLWVLSRTNRPQWHCPATIGPPAASPGLVPRHLANPDRAHGSADASDRCCATRLVCGASVPEAICRNGGLPPRESALLLQAAYLRVSELNARSRVWKKTGIHSLVT